MDAQHSDKAAPDQRRPQRKLRNYLLDKKFQLKYTGIVVAITALLSLVLGYYLHREIVVSQNTILARDLAADTFIIPPGDIGKRQKVSQQLDQEFNEALATKLAVIVKVNNAPSGTTAELYQDSFGSELHRTTSVLVAALVVFLLVLTVVWVYLTHKIAGPAFKLKLLFSKISGDRLALAGRLRKGDELQDTFIAFSDMIDRLRDDRRSKADRIDDILKKMNDVGELRDEEMDMLRAIKEEMISSLGD